VHYAYVYYEQRMFQLYILAVRVAHQRLNFFN